jgi:hypothetical protein
MAEVYPAEVVFTARSRAGLTGVPDGGVTMDAPETVMESP